MLWNTGARSAGGGGSVTRRLTMAIAATLVGYYLVYGIGLRWQIRRPAPVSLPEPNASAE